MLLSPAVTLEDGVSLEAVRFPGGDNELCGTLTMPSSSTDTAVLFSHGWSGNRTGPHGLLRHLAQALASEGLPSLRFDFAGRGESRGNGLDVSLATQSADLEAAAHYLRRRTNATRLLLLGICSGGNVIIGTLPRLPQPCGMILLSVYPFSDGDTFSRSANRTLHFAKVYWHKLWRRDTWARCLRGELDFGQILHVLFGHFKDRGKSRAPVEASATAAPGRVNRPAGEEGRTTSAPPTRHLHKLKSGVPALMIYGGSDPDAGPARSYYESFAREHDLPVEFRELASANHNFSSCEWTQTVVEETLSFCRKTAGTPPQPLSSAG